MEPIQNCSKLKCSDIAAKTLETLPGMNDINTQMQIRSIISAPVLHPTIAPPPISADINIDLHSEVTELATNLANGGSIDHFMLPQGILDQVDNDGKIILLTRKRDNLKTLLERKLQKLQEAPSRSADTIPQQTLQFHSNCDDTIPQKSRNDDTIKLNFQKLQEAPTRSANTIPQQPLQFHSNSDDTIMNKFFLPNSRKVCPLFEHFAQMGSGLPK